MSSININNPIITRKTIAIGVMSVLGLILFLIVNPFHGTMPVIALW